MKNDPTFWILARSSGLLAYALLTSSVLAGLVLKARPFGAALKAATVADIHRFLAMLGLGAVLATIGARPRQHRAHRDRQPARARPGSLPSAGDGPRSARRRADGDRLRLVLAEETDRGAQLAAPALGHVSRSSASPPCTA